MQEFSGKEYDQFKPWVKEQWGLDIQTIRMDIPIEGSPERTVSRTVFEDVSGKRFLLEKFSKQKHPLRDMVAKAVFYLNQHGLTQALAYKQSSSGQFLPFYKQGCFQVSEFLDTTGIKRPDYLMSPMVGESFAQFLVKLSSSAIGIEDKIRFSQPFSIKTYIYELFGQMKKHNPEIHDKFLVFLSFLEDTFMESHDQLPLGFSHGDLHPLNVIWEDDQIKAVIDWEFVGIKPDIYDAANLVGCAGIEDPNGLGMPMVMQFLKTLRTNSLYSEQGWKFFPEYVLALRFAWLSEWLRKKDSEMLEMEEAYMKILMDNVEVIRSGWDL